MTNLSYVLSARNECTQVKGMGSCFGSKTYVIEEGATLSRKVNDVKQTWAEKEREMARYTGEIVIVGSESAGKSTLARALVGFKAKEESTPTRNVQVYECSSSPVELPLRVWDVGSSVGIRLLWPTFCQTLAINTLIMVVTPRVASSASSLREVAEWLRYFVCEEAMKSTKVLLVVNNQGGQVAAESFEKLLTVTRNLDVKIAIDEERFAQVECDVKNVWNEPDAAEAVAWAVWPADS